MAPNDLDVINVNKSPVNLDYHYDLYRKLDKHCVIHSFQSIRPTFIDLHNVVVDYYISYCPLKTSRI